MGLRSCASWLFCDCVYCEYYVVKIGAGKYRATTHGAEPESAHSLQSTARRDYGRLHPNISFLYRAFVLAKNESLSPSTQSGMFLPSYSLSRTP